MKRGIMHLLPFNLESASSSIADSGMNRGDLTPLVYGFLKILSGTIEDTIGVLKRKKDQLQRYEKKIDALGFHDKLMEEMYYMYGDQWYVFQYDIEGYFDNISHKAAKKIMKQIGEEGYEIYEKIVDSFSIRDGYAALEHPENPDSYGYPK